MSYSNARALCAITFATLMLGPGVGRASGDKIWNDPDPSTSKAEIPSFAPLSTKLMPAVVSIVVTQEMDEAALDPMLKFFKDFFGDGLPESFENKGVGSGVIINADGYIVTNHHVVASATSILVTLHDGTEHEAHVVGSDPDTDVALIKIETTGLPTVALGDSDSVQVGDWVLAIGNPFGLSATITAGIVSAKGRHEVGPYKEHKYQDFIQTDAPINPGSSGGPLFDLAGNVVAINTAINAAGQGIGFAIPINMIKPILPQLVEHGTVLRSWLGVSIQGVTPSLAKAFGLPGSPRGALVADVVGGSPAAKAGITVGDIILAFDGESIDSVDELSWLASTKGQGMKAKLQVFSDGKTKTVKVSLASLPGKKEAPAVSGKKGPGKKAAPDDLGIALSKVDPQSAAALGIDPVDGEIPGALVSALEVDSPLAAAGLDRGDVILKLDGNLVKSPSETLEALEKTGKGELVLLYVISGQSKGFVTYQP